MKKNLWFLFYFVALPLQAQSLLGTLNAHQNSLEAEMSSSGSPSEKTPAPEVVATSESSSVGSGQCDENDQTSLPLAYVTSLIQAKDAKLEVDYDPRRAILKVSAPDMISNCSSMLQWKLKEQNIVGSKAYALEVKIKQGEDCSDDGCEYKVAKVEGGAFKEWEKIRLKPNLKGFEECLSKSGVIADDKVKQTAIYSAPVMEKFNDIRESGNVLFVSRGPSSALVKAKYGNFETIDKCNHYESIGPDNRMILSYHDEERQRLDAEAAKLKDCGINEYSKVADFLEKYEDYASQLGEVRDRLILEASRKAAKAIGEGKYTEEDLKIMNDFDKYIVQPKVDQVRVLYQELRALEGTSQAGSKKAELSLVLKELKSLNAKPYFQTIHTKKLISDGRFEESDKLNTMKLTLDAYSKVGTKSGNVVITPEVANSRVNNGRNKFIRDLDLEKEHYAIRTGEVTGQEEYYQSLAKRMRHNIEQRTANFTSEIQDEFGRMQQGGYCYKYFRNTQKCIQDSMERIKELQALLVHYNKVDAERAVEYDNKSKEYGKLEAEGRRYLAAQNGEEAPEERVTAEPTPADTTIPSRRTSNGSYTFDYKPQQAMQGPQQPQQFQGGIQNPLAGWQGGMFQQPQNPYQMYGQQQGYQQPFMGQQAFNGFGGGGYGAGGYGGYGGTGGGYNFQWGGGQQQQPMGGYGQQQQPGYWGQPYQAYNMYSMYGR